MVSNRWLIFLSAILWSAVGVMLNGFAISWFPQLTKNQIIWAIIIGIVIGVVKTLLVFKKLIQKNIARIRKIEGKVPFWKFQRPVSYYLILGMMALGIFLRKSGIVPKPYLAPVYIGIGSALFLSSLYYYYSFFTFNSMAEN